jgi:hypothetical protein
LERSKDEKKSAKFLEVRKEVQITIPILDAVMHIPMYAKFFKELLTKKRSIEEPKFSFYQKNAVQLFRNICQQSLMIQCQCVALIGQ